MLLARLTAIVAGAILLTVGLIYGMQERRREPEPFNLTELEALGELTEVRPHLQSLIEAIKSDELPGAVDAYRNDLELADEVRNMKDKTTAYLFFSHPNERDQEGHPVLVLFAQKKFDHVYRVAVTIPCY